MQRHNRFPSILLALSGGAATLLTLILHGPTWLAVTFAIGFLVLAIITQPESNSEDKTTLQEECEQWRATQKLD